MGKALFLANRARETGDVPVGAVVVDAGGRIIGRGWNCREGHHDPTGHAEVVALREAGCALGTWRLTGCTLVVTLEPCTMCAGAILASRIDRVVFGAWDPKAGAAGSLRDVLRDARVPHPTEVIGGVLAQEAAMQLRSFFIGRRSANEMPVVAAPVHEPEDLAAQAPTPRVEAPAAHASGEGVPAQLITPDAPAAPAAFVAHSASFAPVVPASAPAAHAAPVAPAARPQGQPVPMPPPAGLSRHRGSEASPLPRRAGRPFSERVSGNADDPADIPAASSVLHAPDAPPLPPSRPPVRGGAPVASPSAPEGTRGPVTKSVPQIRPVRVRPTAVVPDGAYTPAQPTRPPAAPEQPAAAPPAAPARPAAAPTHPAAPAQPAAAASQVRVGEVLEPIPAPPAFPQRATQRATDARRRPLPQAFEPEPTHRVDYELSPRQFNDVDPVTSGIRVRRSARRRGSARH